MAGKIIPPTLPPALAKPVATPNHIAKSGNENHDTNTGTPAPNVNPIPIPVPIPCARTNCQYFVQKLVARTETLRKMLPPVKQCWKRPLSIWVLTKMDMKKRRNIWIEPIQAIEEGV